MKERNNESLYIGSLDGLRFLAFLLVLVHHSATSADWGALSTIQQYGWVGVELFFVISSFLFFHLFDAEVSKRGHIDVVKFYIRRFLRIYPLMVLFPLVMLLIYGARDDIGWWRLVGIAMFADNFVTWVKGYNVSIQSVPHLWSLAFEFQIYLFIPLAFLLKNKIGDGRFLSLLAAIYAYCFFARMLFWSISAPHPIIWVTPFLQPDAVIAGIAISVRRPTWPCRYSALIGFVAGALFLALPLPWDSGLGSAFSYPTAAIMCAAILDVSLRASWLKAALSNRNLRYLGSISFGLYVYHRLAQDIAIQWLAQLQVLTPGSFTEYLVTVAATFALTVAAGTASFYIVEKPFLLLKDRFTVVFGRPEQLTSPISEAPPQTQS